MTEPIPESEFPLADRRRSSDVSPLEAMVGHAVGTALDRRFWQMTATAVATAVLTALLVSMPITLWVSSQTQASSRRAAKFNCDALRSIADNMSLFVATDARLRNKEEDLTNKLRTIRVRPGVLAQLLADPEYQTLNAQAVAIEKDTQHYWTNTIVPNLTNGAHTDCAGIDG